MDRVRFSVNDIQCSVGPETSSSVSLLDYIRSRLELRGTKYMCREGGCGACIVSAVLPDGSTLAVNSCLVSVFSCQNWKISTIEGIGNRSKGYNKLQTTLAESDGTQCGYCSPGWVMAAYSLLKTKKLTRAEIEKSLASNGCRCTGYRPILDAFKKFASDAPPQSKLTIDDIEDLDLCKNKKCLQKCDEDWCFVSELSLEEENIAINLEDDKYWFKVHNTNDIFHILRTQGDDSYMLVAGNTGKGVVPILEYPRILIDISEVSELRGYYFDQNLVIGASNTLTELLDIFETVSQTREDFSYLHVLYEHVEQVAHIPVRNIGTIAGNLMVKHKNKEFTSDIFLIFETVGAVLTILESSGVKKVLSLSKFLQEDMRSKVIYNVLLPPLNSDNHVFTYKVMKRAQNAKAIVNAGFLYTLDKNNFVLSSRIVFSGLQAGYSRASETEGFLNGKNLFTNDTLQAAVKILMKELKAEEMPTEGSIEYRKKLAVGLFYKGLLSLCPAEILDVRYTSGAVNLHRSRGVSSGKQVYSTDSTVYPINEPIHKVEGLIQCAGEAPYTEDVPAIPHEVFATFVLSTVSVGTILNIDASKALKKKGVIAFYTAKDIPGTNSFTKGANGSKTDEVLLSDGSIQFYNQPIGIIVAESQHIAEVAATLVNVTYANTKMPVLDIKQAKNMQNRATPVKIINASNEGHDIARIISGSNTVYGQYHYCYENLVCVSWPTEEGLAMRASTQGTDSDQVTSSACLNIDENRIDVENRRCGGAFGLKISRSLQVSVACSLVTYKLNRPCRFISPLRSVMRAVGKRFSASIDYEVGVNDHGIIQYMNYNLYEDNGYIVNEALIAWSFDVYYNCYQQNKFNFKAFDVTTDKASNSFCRSPGSLETISTTETIMERISYELNIDPIDVRMANLDRKYKDTFQSMLKYLKDNSDYSTRRKSVTDFNLKNRWKKRGLRFFFMKWNSKAPYYSDVSISILHGDGTVIITHGGIEMGQGINTKVIQVCAYYLKIPINKIIVKACETTSTPNSAPTVASATSQTITIGVQRACEDLLKRLQPLREELGDTTWENLISKAYETGIDLQGHGFVNSKDVYDFDVYGMTLAEVEIDVLTGEWNIIRVDLLEDVGRSISPLIDIGQIEGSFIMGLGYFTTEDLIYDRKGELLTDRTWNYKIPLAQEIPVDFRVYFRPKSFGSKFTLGAKATGEPATVMGAVIPFAMREAIVAARVDAGLSSRDWFQIDGPFTVEKICLATSTNIQDFKFY